MINQQTKQFIRILKNACCSFKTSANLYKEVGKEWPNIFQTATQNRNIHQIKKEEFDAVLPSIDALLKKGKRAHNEEAQTLFKDLTKEYETMVHKTLNPTKDSVAIRLINKNYKGLIDSYTDYNRERENYDNRIYKNINMFTELVQLNLIEKGLEQAK